MGRTSQAEQARDQAYLDTSPLPGQLGFPFMTMAPAFSFYFNTPLPATSHINYSSSLSYQHAELTRQNLKLKADIKLMKINDGSSLSYEHAELTRQNLELKADIELMMKDKTVSRFNSRQHQRRMQQLISQRGKSGATEDANDVSLKVNSASTMLCTTEAVFAPEADETPNSRVARAGHRVIRGKSCLKADADALSRSTSMATTAGYATEATCEPDETPASTVSRKSRRVTFSDEVEGSPWGATDGEKVRKVRFLLREDSEDNHGATFESKNTEEAKPPQQTSRTAVMMCNIPKEYTRANIIELLDQQGFNGLYRLVYLPTKMHSDVNYCYTFICMTTEENAEKIQHHFTGFKDWMLPSDKVCEVRFNDVLCTTDEHIQHYRDSPIMHDSVEDRFKPALFENGQRIPFPEPTKEIRAPRLGPKRTNKSAAYIQLHRTRKHLTISRASEK